MHSQIRHTTFSCNWFWQLCIILLDFIKCFFCFSNGIFTCHVWVNWLFPREFRCNLVYWKTWGFISFRFCSLMLWTYTLSRFLRYSFRIFLLVRNILFSFYGNLIILDFLNLFNIPVFIGFLFVLFHECVRFAYQHVFEIFQMIESVFFSCFF